MKSVNFLDVNFNLDLDIFKPYMKPNGAPVYVHHDSNHPRSILKNIPKSINRRLSSISSNQEVFNAACQPYQDALEKSGYDYILNFDPPPPKNTGGKNRKRRVLYFNPQFSRSVKSKVGKEILKLLDTHFPKGSPLHKIINRNNVKISYRCMGNFKQKIAAHNSKVTKQDQPNRPPGCNCTGQMGPCPLEGHCLARSVVYGAEVIDSNLNSETYTGLTSNTFKKRFYKHRSSFTHEDQEHVTFGKRKNLNFEIRCTL